MSDLALVRRLLAGEEAAFDEFFGWYFPRLYRFALARVGREADAAEDLAQRTLIRALDALPTYRGDGALLTWLCTICRHEIGAWREREGRRAHVSFGDEQPEVRAALESLMVSADDPEASLLRQEITGLVQLTLDHLPDRYSDVLDWKYRQGLSVTDVAARLGVGYKAAESMLTRARVAFREGFTLVAGAWPAHRIAGPSKGS